MKILWHVILLILIRQQSSTGMPVGECRPEIFWYKLMNHGKQIIRAFGISNRIPCSMDTKISEADPESWGEGIPFANLAEDTAGDAWGGDRRAKYPGGPYPHDNDHSPEIFGQRGHRPDKVQECKPITEKVHMVRRRILEGKYSMVPWIFCIDCRAERAIDHKIRSLAGSAGFRSSEA